jgi:hypothetical protein
MSQDAMQKSYSVNVEKVGALALSEEAILQYQESG